MKNDLPVSFFVNGFKVKLFEFHNFQLCEIEVYHVVYVGVSYFEIDHHSSC